MMLSVLTKEKWKGNVNDKTYSYQKDIKIRKKKLKIVGLKDEEEENDNLSDMSDISLDSTSKLKFREIINLTIKFMIEDLLKKFKNSIQIQIIYIYFMTYFIGNYTKSLFDMMKMFNRKHSLIYDFQLN